MSKSKRGPGRPRKKRAYNRKVVTTTPGNGSKRLFKGKEDIYPVRDAEWGKSQEITEKRQRVMTKLVNSFTNLKFGQEITIPMEDVLDSGYNIKALYHQACRELASSSKYCNNEYVITNVDQKKGLTIGRIE